MPGLALVVVPDGAQAFLDIVTDTEDLAAASTVYATTQLLDDLDRVTTRMQVYGSRAERDAAHRLRAAAGLEAE